MRALDTRERAVRILLAIDQALVREALCTLLEERGHEVVAAVDSGREAIELARRHEPDVALLDASVGGVGVVEAARRLAREAPATAVVVLCGQSPDSILIEALGSGAKGFVTTDLDGQEFCRILERAASGSLAVTTELANRLLEEIVRRAAQQHRPVHQAMVLTPREQEVLKVMSRGHASNRELARMLDLSENTVRFHVRNILEKLRLHSRAAAVAYAHRHRIVETDEGG